MTHAGDAHLMYKMAGTMFNSSMGGQSSNMNNDSYISAYSNVNRMSTFKYGDKSNTSSAHFGAVSNE